MSRKKEIERRKKRGRKESFEIESIPAEPSKLPVCFTVQSTSGRSYRVALRHLADPLNHCTCPDFDTNGLGTCKHIEAVVFHLEQHREKLYKKALEQSQNPYHRNLVYIDATKSPPRIRMHMATPSDRLQALQKKVFGARNLLTQKKMATAFPDLRARSETLGIDVPAEVETEIEQTLKHNELADQCRREASNLQEKLNDRSMAPFLVDGATFLLKHMRALLFDDTGLQPDRQATLAACHLFECGLVKKVAILCPEARTKQWLRLLKQRTDVGVALLEATGTESDTNASAPTTAAFLVAPYKQAPYLQSALAAPQVDLLIMDQVHRFKSWQGAAGRVIKSLAVDFVFALGSPALLQRPTELFYLVQFLAPHLLGPSWAFFDKHIVKDARGAIVDFKNLEKLQKELEPLFMRRTRSDVRDDLNPPIELLYVVKTTAAQRKGMVPVLSNLLKKISGSRDWSPVDRAEIVAQIARLRKLCDYLEPGVGEQASPKVRELLFLLDDLSDEDSSSRFIVFTRFRDIAAKLSDILSEKGFATAHLSRVSDEQTRGKAIEGLRQNTLDGLVVADEILHELPALDQHLAVHLDMPWTPVTLKQRQRVGGKSTSSPPELEAFFILADSIEEQAYNGLKTDPERLEALVSDSAVELEALPAQGSEPLSGVVDLMLDVAALKKALPQKNAARPARKKSGSKPRKPRRKKSATAKSRAQRARRAQRPAAARDDIIVFSLTTRRQPARPDDEQALKRLGLAVAVTYSFNRDKFTAWRHEYVNDLIRTLRSAALVVGWQPASFEYKILSAYTGLKLTQTPTINLLTEVKEALGFHIPAELLTEATLEKRRRLLGDQSVMLWRQGRIQELAERVYEDVRMIRDLFISAFHGGKLFYRAAPSGEVTPIPIDVKSEVPKRLYALLQPKRRS